MLNHKPQRRDFLKQTALLSAGTLLVPRFLFGSSNGGFKGNRLIVLQLSGGNDGLNTIIPFRNDILLKARRGFISSTESMGKISDEVAFHAALKATRSLYDEGELCILSNVGYPNPNKSHFRSMDIWQSASSSNQYLSTGWLGRYLDEINTGNEIVPAIETGNILSLALKGKELKGLPVQDSKQLYRMTKDIDFAHSHNHDHEMAEFLYKTMNDTRQSAAYLFEKLRLYPTPSHFPNDSFGKSLSQIAQMIGAGVETSIYYANLSGFDTHVNQADRQARLLETYDKAVGALRKELVALGEWQNTLILTFSEFGRRVEMNASRGTDHGKANYTLLAGGALKKSGLYNGLPDLTQLDDGDLKYTIDFRQVYSTILEKWLKTPSSTILGETFSTLDFV